MPGFAVDTELAELMSDVFAAHRKRLDDSVDGSTGDGDAALWRQLCDLGLARLTGSETSGGSGAGWPAAAELLRAAASHRVPTPVVEHDLLAGWLLETAGLPADDSRRSACVLDETGTARDVGWAQVAERIVVAWRGEFGWRVTDVDVADLTITPGRNVADEPRDIVVIDTTLLTGVAVDDGVLTRFRLRGALARAVQVCGALDGALAVSVAHAADREQFGRPLARFQAVTNLVADIAAEAALARAATEAALGAAVQSDWTAPDLTFLVAVARSCVGRAASVVVRNAHQVLGAIGTTQEHQLHGFTLPALAWRSEFGSVHDWEHVVTDAAIEAGVDGLWP
ncbi:MAG: acyl-CoA dehydrogenase family protein, partial [Actinomycetota bacterium]|nr:acyl-CoA dehydrogenase family protein [Actinomycetota bacterium]